MIPPPPSITRADTLFPFKTWFRFQRLLSRYHSWGSQNEWLRQITARNYLYQHPGTGARHGIADEDWITVTSHHGSITGQAKFASNMQPDTVWTWNANFACTEIGRAHV